MRSPHARRLHHRWGTASAVPRDEEAQDGRPDTFMAYVGVHPDVGHAEADYELVKDLHIQGGADRRLRRRGPRAVGRR
jgi:hypothetical protein